MAFSITNLIPGVAEIKSGLAIAVGVAILAAGGWMVWEVRDIKHLKEVNAVLVQNNKTLQENNDVLKGNLNTCTNANATNTTTIQSLIKERKDAQDALEQLAAMDKTNMEIIGSLKQNLDRLKKNPANDGTLAPDLRETIRGIQAGVK